MANDGNVCIAPTLATMAAIYALSREGGPQSERFTTYVHRVAHEWGLAAYNPMAGAAAFETVTRLLELDAETLAANAARRVMAACRYDEPVTLALAVRSQGFWTDRTATEVHDRTSGKPTRPGFGIVSLWSREAITPDDIVRESAAEAVRVMWAVLHGPASTLLRVLAREGLAYALATTLVDAGPYASALSAPEALAVENAIAVLGDTHDAGDIAGVLFGDPVARTLGWTPLGIPDDAGYRYAVREALRLVAAAGAPAALRRPIPRPREEGERATVR